MFIVFSIKIETPYHERPSVVSCTYSVTLYSYVETVFMLPGVIPSPLESVNEDPCIACPTLDSLLILRLNFTVDFHQGQRALVSPPLDLLLPDDFWFVYFFIISPHPKTLSLTSGSWVNRGLVFRSNDVAQRLLTFSDAQKVQNGLGNQATKEPYLFLHIRKNCLKQVLDKQLGNSSLG